MKNIILLLCFFSFSAISWSQNKSNELVTYTHYKLPKKVEKTLGVKFIEGNTFYYGSMPFDPISYNLEHGEEDTFLLNNPGRSQRITYSSFYIGVNEVTNGQYREFVNWVRDSIAHAMLGHYVKAGDKQYIDWSKKLDWQKDKKLAELYFKGDDQYHRKTALDNSKLIYSSGKYSNKPLNIYPDTICWVRDFSYAYNEALSANYFSHSAYTDFPVVGVSWEQALAYCDWKSNQINVLLRKMGQTEIDIRLPNEMEWEFAARSEASEINEKSHFAWSQSDSKILDKDGNYLANFGPIKDENGILIKDYMETGQNDNFGALYCSKVGTFAPYNGMYDLAGNVDEWVLDRAIPSDLNYCFDEFEGNDNLDKLRRADLNFESFCSNYFDSIFAKKDEAAYRKKMQIVLEEILAGTNIKPYLKKYTLNQILDELTKEFRMLCADDKRLAKGGSWNSDLANVATGSRRAYNQNRGYSFVGFRIACSSVQKIK